jgi:hypothetical protein
LNLGTYPIMEHKKSNLNNFIIYLDRTFNKINVFIIANIK